MALIGPFRKFVVDPSLFANTRRGECDRTKKRDEIDRHVGPSVGLRSIRQSSIRRLHSITRIAYRGMAEPYLEGIAAIRMALPNSRS